MDAGSFVLRILLPLRGMNVQLVIFAPWVLPLQLSSHAPEGPITHRLEVATYLTASLVIQVETKRWHHGNTVCK